MQRNHEGTQKKTHIPGKGFGGANMLTGRK